MTETKHHHNKEVLRKCPYLFQIFTAKFCFTFHFSCQPFCVIPLTQNTHIHTTFHFESITLKKKPTRSFNDETKKHDDIDACVVKCKLSCVGRYNKFIMNEGY